MQTSSINGFYGHSNEATIFVCETSSGYWYAVEDSYNVNCTCDDSILSEGCDIEQLDDHDSFTTLLPVESEDDL